MVDAYQDITIPFQMSSKEFFTLVKDHLTDDGVMIVNMNMRGQSEGSINDYLQDTIASVFDSVYTADVSGSTNRELFAFMGDTGLETFKENLSLENDTELINMMNKVYSDLSQKYAGGSRILTDDKAPVELLGMKVIDELIEDEVSYYKEIYKKEGIEGLLEAF